MSASGPDTPPSRRRPLLGLLGLLGLAGLLPVAARATAEGDATAIRRMLRASFDRPDAPLLVDPLVLRADHAIAGWSQGEAGGRALLRRGRQGWRIVLCSGDGLKETDLLLHAGVPPRDAATLARSLAIAEARIAPDRLALLGRFDGVVMMEEGAAHGAPANGPHH